MTEAEWLTCTEPKPMLEFLGDRASDRKFRLFGCACCRRLWDLLPSDLNRQAVQAIEEHPDTVSGELYPEGVDSHPVLGEALVASSSREYEWGRDRAYWAVKFLGRSFYKLTPLRGAVVVALQAAAVKGEGGTRAEAAAGQAALLRDIIGNPFRPVALDPAWRTPTVLALAQAAYDDRLLPAGTFDLDRLAVLSDALEDAGCDSADILSHLRGPGPHVRGCWVLDLLLGKE
ncbi:MAG TPA: hypothetical protein VKD72_29630 [Gemmataceae bacterium]|nr:hypothetical protein [Gemmataceae bacterium]